MRVLLSWSSGKDSAWTLHTLRSEGIEVVGLLTTINEEVARVSMQGVRLELLNIQAESVGLPVWEIPLPSPCPNEEYERRMGEAMGRAADEGITHVAFGDLFLSDVRAYREGMLAPTVIEPLFPIWCGEEGTGELAEQMLLQRGLSGDGFHLEAVALVESSAGRIGSFVDQLLLYCYHYDPAAGRYGLIAMNLVRIGGAVTLVLLVGFIWISRRREAMQHQRSGIVLSKSAARVLLQANHTFQHSTPACCAPLRRIRLDQLAGSTSDRVAGGTGRTRFREPKHMLKSVEQRA